MNLNDIILVVLGIVGSLAFFTFVRNLISPPETKESPIEITKDISQKEVSVFDRIDPSRSIIDKIDYFFARKLKLDKKIENMYILLGKPENTDPLKILHKKEMFAFLFPLIVYFLTGSFFSFLVFIPIGFIIPDVIISSKIRKRQDDILRNFPQFVDLAALMIESGLDYITAFDKISKISTVKSELDKEVERLVHEVQFGYTRRDALRRFAERTGLGEIRSFVGLVIQSDELGTSLVDLLRNFSADMRFRRLTRAEKLAAQASTKMLIPLFIFIFPVVFILVLGPVIYDLIKSGGMPF